MLKTTGSHLPVFAFLLAVVPAQGGVLLPGVEPAPGEVYGPLPVEEPAPDPVLEDPVLEDPVVTVDKLGRRIRQLEPRERAVRVRELVEQHRRELREEQKRRMEQLKRRLAEKKAARRRG